MSGSNFNGLLIRQFKKVYSAVTKLVTPDESAYRKSEVILYLYGLRVTQEFEVSPPCGA